MIRAIGRVVVLLLCCVPAAQAKKVIAAAPAPTVVPAADTGDRAPVVDGDVTEAAIAGMKVIVKKVPGAEFVAGRIILRGGVRNWGDKDAGIDLDKSD